MSAANTGAYNVANPAAMYLGLSDATRSYRASAAWASANIGTQSFLDEAEAKLRSAPPSRGDAASPQSNP